jgi:hypothetical protein
LEVQLNTALHSLLVLGAAALVLGCGSSSTPSTKSGTQVLLVGTYHGIKGQYDTIQAAVDAAKPGAWILVAPGDYHENDDIAHPPSQAMAESGAFGGVLITKAGLHIRGMDRNTTIIDGDKAGAPTSCDPTPAYQNYGAADGKGGHFGRNGIVAYKADDVWIENLTVCNFLAGSGSSGFEIWWDGGEDSGTIGMKGYWGTYLNATSTFYKDPTQGATDVNATYGIFANSAEGPAKWDYVYASNMNDSGGYVGACQQCDVTIDHSKFEYNALGYSGTNSGGTVIIENSEFDHNQDGLDTNTQVNGDPPPPQDGRCANGGTSPITHTNSCWVFTNNKVHDNNNADVPAAGSAAQGPVGTGMTISGGRWDTVQNNTFSNNGAWGVLFVPYPDSGTPYAGKSCADYGGVESSLFGCVLDPEADALIGNTFVNNGYFGNETNGDYGELTLNKGEPQNCFANNTAPDGSYPANLETSQKTCGPMTTAAQEGALLAQVACDTGTLPCGTGMNYPKITTNVVMRPLPSNLPSMPDPCNGVPSNPWCK